MFFSFVSLFSSSCFCQLLVKTSGQVKQVSREQLEQGQAGCISMGGFKFNIYQSFFLPSKLPNIYKSFSHSINFLLWSKHLRYKNSSKLLIHWSYGKLLLLQVFTIRLETAETFRCREVILAHGLTVPRQGHSMIDAWICLDMLG